MDSQSKIFFFFRGGSRLLIFLALIYLPLLLSAQLSGMAELSSSFVEKGEVFSIEFTFANNITSSLEVVEPELPEGLEKVGDSVLSFDIRENQTKVKISFRSNKEGFLTIPAFIFRGGRREEWKSQPISVGISVHHFSTEGIEIPLELEVRVSKTNLCLGESMGVGLFASGGKRFTYLDLLSLQVNFPTSLRVERVPLFFEMHTEKARGMEVIFHPLANWIITPVKGGEIVLPIISLEKNGEIYQSKPVSIQVKAREEEDIKGVGVYDMKTGISSREILGSSTVDVTVALTGEGNFKQFSFPKLNVEGGVIVGMSEENSLTPTEKGFRGSLFKTYQVSPSSLVSNLQIFIPSWTYWDTEQREIKELPGSSYSVRVMGKVVRSPTSLEEKVKALTFLNEEEMRSQKFSFLFMNPLCYLASIPGLVAIILLFFKRTFWKVLGFLMIFMFSCILIGLFRVGEERVSRSQNFLETLSSNLYQEQQETLLLEINNLLDLSIPIYYRANLLYNKGILLFKIGRDQEAILSLYTALTKALLHFPARRALQIISLSLGKNEIISFQNVYWLNWIFVGILLTFNLIWFSWFFFQKDRVSRFFSLLMFSILFGVELFFFFNLSRQIYSPIGILHGSLISVSKVPDFFTRSWIFLNGGLAVYLVEETDYFYRIILPSGIQGWVEKSFIWKI